jgi:hypothetical protein
MRYALFIALYAQFEQALLRICEDRRTRYGIDLALGDLAGRGIRKYHAFFRKGARVAFPNDEPEWDRILRLGEIRNHLAHKNRWITAKPEDKPVVTALATERYLSYHLPGEIYFAKQFIPNIADLFVAFLLELAYRAVKERSAFGGTLRNRISIPSVRRRLAKGAA